MRVFKDDRGALQQVGGEQGAGRTRGAGVCQVEGSPAHHRWQGALLSSGCKGKGIITTSLAPSHLSQGQQCHPLSPGVTRAAHLMVRYSSLVTVQGARWRSARTPASRR